MGKFNEADGKDTADAAAQAINKEFIAKILHLGYDTPDMEGEPRTGIYYVIECKSPLLTPNKETPYWEVKMVPTATEDEIPDLELAAKKSQIVTERFQFVSTRGYILNGSHIIFETNDQGQPLSPRVINPSGALNEYFKNEAVAARINRPRGR
ncbi:hypothetical protein HYS92_02190 [Candidatus Daviesbacteria bacterium]|nr:hypothetical protein [Candidatus Daviesbacteria bacterium]